MQQFFLPFWRAFFSRLRKHKQMLHQPEVLPIKKRKKPTLKHWNG